MSSTESKGLRLLDIDDPEAGILAYEVDGKITAEQAQEVFGRIEDAAKEGKKLRLYYLMHGFPRAELSVFFDKLKMMGKILKTIERMAIVGGQGWLTVYAKAFDPVTKAELRHFKKEDEDEAIAWIRE